MFGARPAEEIGYVYEHGDVAFGCAGSYGVPGPGQLKVLAGCASPMSKAKSTGVAVVVAVIVAIDAVACSTRHVVGSVQSHVASPTSWS
ncbi:MAG: hypothetical protein JO265_05430 [Acidimicrobiia bacterium]|nr:hypothetical protein [Acidimicrobiia bacterium]